MTQDIGGFITQATAHFTLALALAFVIERVLEVLKAGVDLADSWGDWHKFWTRQAEGLKVVLEKRLRVFQHLGPERVAQALRRAYDMLLRTPDGDPMVVPVLSGDLVRVAWIRLGSKLLGIVLGVALAFRFHIDLFSSFKPGAESAWYWVALSGAALGLGAGPVHKIITTIETKRAAKPQIVEEP